MNFLPNICNECKIPYSIHCNEMKKYEEKSFVVFTSSVNSYLNKKERMNNTK